MAGGWIYFMTNRRNGILYVGVTSNLPRRAYEHRAGLITGFTKRYGLKMLVYAEPFDDIRYAIQREKAIKHWPRAWKVRLIIRQIQSGSICTIRSYDRHARPHAGHPRLKS
jgi:putative endonuclease